MLLRNRDNTPPAVRTKSWNGMTSPWGPRPMRRAQPSQDSLNGIQYFTDLIISIINEKCLISDDYLSRQIRIIQLSLWWLPSVFIKQGILRQSCSALKRIRELWGDRGGMHHPEDKPTLRRLNCELPAPGHKFVLWSPPVCAACQASKLTYSWKTRYWSILTSYGFQELDSPEIQF